MNYLAITILLCIGTLAGAGNLPSDNPEINNVTVPIPITEIDHPTTPQPTTPKPTTTSTTTPVTPTSKSTTTTTTTTPTPVTKTTPNPTTPTTKPTSPTLAPNSTMAPITTTASPHHDRKFDGPSFVGGIILALGLVAIGFVAFKFYKARTEMNYHTL